MNDSLKAKLSRRRMLQTGAIGAVGLSPALYSWPKMYATQPTAKR